MTRHKACVTYLQNWYGAFYPERPDIVAELEALARTGRPPDTACA